VNLYRIKYRWPNGQDSHVSLAALPSQILQRASDYVRAFTGGELLEIAEDRPLQPTLELTP